MKKRVSIPYQLALEIDAMRGSLSRSKYLDALLKKHQGVTLSHTRGADCQKSRKKPKP
jgi:hypothetical protein